MTMVKDDAQHDSRVKSLSPPPLKKRKVDSTINKKAVSSFFTPSSKKVPDRITWTVIRDSLLFARYTPTPFEKGRRKIAAFDLDSTLIQTSSGNIFSKDATDWRWWDPIVPGVLKQLYSDGYTICILTNQGSVRAKQDPKSKTIKGDQKSLSTFKTKVSAILGNFDFPIILLAATIRDKYRKPRVGMWVEVLEELDLNGHDGLNVEASFFVGDAANIGITFKTPEEFFLHQEPLPYTRLFEPIDYLKNVEPIATGISHAAYEKQNLLDIVIACGSPASGKSTFYWTHLKALGYERVNQDILKTRDKCVKVAEAYLQEHRSVAVDNTNADPETRAVWVRLARKFEIPIRCVYFTAPAKLCEHNDTVRALAGAAFNLEDRSILPHSAFAGFASRFKKPKITEGFADIVEVDFEFHGDEERRKTWSQYWI